MTEVLAHALRVMSTLACAVVVIAFGFWASDEGRAASDGQVALVGASGPGPSTPGTPVTAPASDAKHGGIRGTIEDANAKLISPFDSVAASEAAWPKHLIPALLALLAYGLLARLLINYIPQRT
jgi:hypothetical protein